jgi:predicted transposase YdaD
MKIRDRILGKNNTMDIFDQIVEINVQEGLEEGEQKGVEKAVRKLLTNTKFSPEKIAELLEVPVSLVEKIKEEQIEQRGQNA